jgi:hypothetical protein
MIYERAEGVLPIRRSPRTSPAAACRWLGCLSGLTADPVVPGKLFAVSDSAYDAQPSI